MLLRLMSDVSWSVVVRRVFGEQLGDEAPLVVLARAEDERAIGPVLAAARALLEG